MPDRWQSAANARFARPMTFRAASFLAVLILAAPASAADGVQIPEASGLTLFALGVIGVIVGRHLSIRRGE